MIQVTVGTSTNRVQKNYPGNTTIRSILDENAVDYSTAHTMFDGASLNAGDLDKTLSDLGIREKCMLVSVIKAENA